MDASVSQIMATLNYQRKQTLDMNNKNDEYDKLNKRISNLYNEVDIVKTGTELQNKLAKRLEHVEAKAQDIWFMLGDIRKSIPPSSEVMMNDLKQQTVSLQNFKHQTHKRFDEIKDEFKKAMDANNVADLEGKSSIYLLYLVKLTERINEAVKVLTRTSADRHETKKNFRILEKQVKNIFEILMFTLQGGGP